MRRIDNQKGFTLVEVMFVLLIVGIMMSISIPVFIDSGKKAEKNACMDNMAILNSVYTQWYGENWLSVEPPADYQVFLGYVYPGYLAQIPKCPEKGEYSLTIEEGQSKFSCSIHGEYTLQEK